jgi:hypothetical protein
MNTTFLYFQIMIHILCSFVFFQQISPIQLQILLDTLLKGRYTLIDSSIIDRFVCMCTIIVEVAVSSLIALHSTSLLSFYGINKMYDVLCLLDISTHQCPSISLAVDEGANIFMLLFLVM